MPSTDNLTEDQQQAQDHPPAWNSVFGDDDHPSAYAPLEQPRIPESAKRMASRVAARELEAKQARRLATLRAVAQEQAEDEALDDAQALIREGKKVPEATQRMAVVAAQRRGVQIPTSEILAAPAVHRWKAEQGAR
jgi:hypothetical protein